MVRIAIDDVSLEVTNLDKVFYPATGFTKGDMLRYYEAISPVMLPHLAGRPVTVVRYPNGVAGRFFFEKRCPAKHPEWVSTAVVPSRRHGTIGFCTIGNPQSLLWMANRAAIEYHTYLFRNDTAGRPTMLVFDLDPGAPATLLDCLAIGTVLRDLLAGLGLRCFPKTSGGKGLHLGIPVAGATFTQTKAFAKGVAELLARAEPQRITSIMAKAERRGRVFIDWSQNDHGKTTACAYTLRARERPTVSTPVTWDEVERAHRRGKPDLLRFEADDVVRRVRELGDLYAPTLALAQRLPSISSVAR